MMKSSNNDLLFVLYYYSLYNANDVNEKFKIVCPFHGDLNASLLIDASKNQYYCFGCGAKGNALDFIIAIESCSRIEACVILNKAINGQKGKIVDIRSETRKTNEEYLFEAKRYFYSLPVTNWDEIRGNYIQKRGFTNRVLKEVDCRINYNESYGIIFPMKDMGKFKGYVCRTSNKEVEQKRKYLYNKGFTRRNTLVGQYGNVWPVICEGYMDLLKFRQYGIKNCCAILGWRITEEQIEKLKEHTDCVICALDNTDTGKEGMKILKKHFEVVKFRYMTGLKDPGEMDRESFNFSWANTMKIVKQHDSSVEKEIWRN